MNIASPLYLSYDILDHQSITLFWLPVDHAIGYDIKVEGHRTIVHVKSTEYTMQGLMPLVAILLQVRAVYEGGVHGDWTSMSAQTSFGAPRNTNSVYATFEPINTYNTAFVFDIADSFGDVQSCTLRLRWQPSDNGWWGDLEVPTGTPVISGRRLGLNCGILDDAAGILDGNIVMRSATLNGTAEPDSECFKRHTHQLRWEPDQ